MGCFFSICGTKQILLDSSNDPNLNQNGKNEPKQINLLLLGPGGSGKSTILKQMHKIYNGKIDKKLLEDSTNYIRENIIEDAYSLCVAYNSLQSGDNTVLPKRFQEKKLDTTLSDTEQEYAHNIVELGKDGAFDEVIFDLELVKKIKTFWELDLFQGLFEKRKQSHIMDHTAYFMKHIDRICAENYEATFDDYIRARHTTTGATFYEFKVDIDEENKDWTLKVTDVGGQRTERKKWERCFKDTRAIIYVMSLAAYDQVLFEDHKTNCYDEAFEAFKDLLEYEELHYMDIIVFFNKMDTFREKIKRVPFTLYEPKFSEKEKHSEKAVLSYVKKRIEEIFYGADSNIGGNRRVDFHFTSATDTKQIETVMKMTKGAIVRKMVQEVIIEQK